MTTPADDLHEIKAMLFRLAGDHAALAKRLTATEDRVAEHAVVVDQVEDAIDGLAAQPPEPEPEPELDLRGLVDWVDVQVARLLQRRVPQTGGYPYWCRKWWLHPEAVARFEATRRCWAEAVASSEGSALVTYYEHLDHQLGVLCADNGPFSGCTGGLHTDFGPAQLLGQDEPPASYFDEFALDGDLDDDLGSDLDGEHDDDDDYDDAALDESA